VRAERVGADRWELIRALGAVADSPGAAHAAGSALGLAPISGAEHTDVFVLNLPPYAAAYLGPDGALGGEAADRVAGFWRVMGLDAPGEPDHLSALLGLYASLGEAVTAARHPATLAALSRAQGTLLWEHLRSWLPPYLDAVASLPAPALREWGDLLRRVLDTEADRHPGLPALPLALRAVSPAGVPLGGASGGASGGGVPAGVVPDAGPREMAGALTVPVRSGIILTRHRLAAGAGQAGVGLRIGERRYTLRAMLEQDPVATANWLAAEADRWAGQHKGRHPADQAALWWADRAGQTAQALRSFASSLAGTAESGSVTLA
ncbi:MAG TPA: molecular chaperone TorD family protein, partial [Trebonia sp.]|nr:molecular chaperone TorD family protein [Trebonia sp.]